jgi:hypothetical protein
MRRVAFDFFAARERDTYEAFRAMTQRFLADAASAHAHPFWSDREFGEPSRQDEEIERAFARLREAPVLAVRLGDIDFEERPAVAGCEIVLERRLVHPTMPEGVRYLHDVDVVALVEQAHRHRDVGDLFDAYMSLRGPVALPDFLRALATALARGWLIWV